MSYCLAALCIAGSAAAQCPSFESPFDVLRTGQMPVDVAHADFDSDGHTDFVFANYYYESVSVLFGSDGRRVQLQVRRGPRAVAIGDADGDGDLDIAIVCLGRVSILLGDGAGGFTAWPDLWTEVGIAQIAIGRFDDDAFADLILLRINGDNTSRLELWPGNGHGEWQPPTTLVMPARVEVFAAAHLDAGPTIDIAVAIDDGLIVWFGGRPTPEPVVPIGGMPSAIAAEPGAIALIYQADVFGTSVQHAAWFDVDATGVLTHGPDAVVPEYGFDVAIGDIDGDSDGDVLALGLRLQPLRRQGNTFVYGRPADVGPFANAVTVGDMNRDGSADAVIADALTFGALVSYGHGNGDFGQTPLFTAPLPQSVTLGDLDHDGKLDAVFAGALSGHVTAHLGSGDGRFRLRTDIPTVAWPTSAVLGDFDSDGHLDVALSSLETFDDPERGRLAVHRGDGRGRFGPPHITELAGPSSAVCVADWNRDGLLDVAVAVWDSLYPRGGGVQVFSGNGDFTFQPPTRWGVGPLPMALATADLDNDGYLDLVASFRQFVGRSDGGITWWRGAPGGTFTHRADVITGVEPRRLAIAHIDADAYPDVVVANSHFARGEMGRLAVLRSTGGALVKINEVVCSIETYAPVVADFDGDGWSDVAVANSGNHTVQFWRGNGTGALGEDCEVGTGPRPGSLGLGDLNGDGELDLVTADAGAASATVLMRTGSVTPVTLTALDATTSEHGVELTWSLAVAPSLAWVQVERAVGDAAFAPIGSRLVPAPSMQFIDAESPSDAAYRVRLAFHSGREWTSGTVWAATNVAFDLAPPRLGADGVHLNWSLSQAARRAHVSIIDARGRRVRDVADGPSAAGAHGAIWDRRDAGGIPVARGLYWALLVADGARVARRVLVTSR